jgi:hypothetical protein
MAFAAIKHKTRGAKAVRAYHYGKSKKVHVTVIIDRFKPGLRTVRYTAKACFHSGWKPGNDYLYNDGRRAVYPHTRRRRLWDRCAEGEGNGPSQAVKRALAALAKKKL